MKLQALFRGRRGKRDENGAAPSQPVPTQPAAVKELTQQELEQVQGGQEITIIKHYDKSSPTLTKQL